MSFAGYFQFSGPGGAYTDASGHAQVAGTNTPRFDHDAEGNALGLLVQGSPEAIAADVAALDAGVVGNQGCTILHQYQQPGGAIVSRAIWSTRPTATINALLNTKGWHRSIIVVPRALPVAAGAVSFRGQAYAIEQPLAVDQTLSDVLGIGDVAGDVLTGAE